MTRGRRPPVQREKVEQAHIVQFLAGALNARVYVFGTKRSKGKPCQNCGTFNANDDHGTHQTPGSADVEAFVPPPAKIRTEPGAPAWWLLKVEVKAPKTAEYRGGRLELEQQQYRLLCEGGPAGLHHIVGGLNEVIAWASQHGYVKADNIPHYRRAASVVTAHVWRRRSASSPHAQESR